MAQAESGIAGWVFGGGMVGEQDGWRHTTPQGHMYVRSTVCRVRQKKGGGFCQRFQHVSQRISGPCFISKLREEILTLLNLNPEIDPEMSRLVVVRTLKLAYFGVE